jgi:dienelactone hydrolase
MAKRGIAVLMPALPFHYQRKPKGALISGQGIISRDSKVTVEIFRQAVIETRRGFDWLAQQPEIVSERIGVMGVSLGAIVSSLALKSDSRFASGALVVGGCDLADVLNSSRSFAAGLIRWWGRLGLANLSDMTKEWKAIDPSLYEDSVEQPVLMLNGTNDVIFSSSQVHMLASTWRNPTSFWTDSGHYYPVLLGAYQLVFWFRETLRCTNLLRLRDCTVREIQRPLEQGDRYLHIDLTFFENGVTDGAIHAGHIIEIPMVNKPAPIMIGTYDEVSAHKTAFGDGPWTYYVLPDHKCGSVGLAFRYLQECMAGNVARVYRVSTDKSNRVVGLLPVDKSDILRWSVVLPGDSSYWEWAPRRGAYWEQKNLELRSLGTGWFLAEVRPGDKDMGKPSALEDLRTTFRSAFTYTKTQVFGIGASGGLM